MAPSISRPKLVGEFMPSVMPSRVGTKHAGDSTSPTLSDSSSLKSFCTNDSMCFHYDLDHDFVISKNRKRSSLYQFSPDYRAKESSVRNKNTPDFFDFSESTISLSRASSTAVDAEHTYCDDQASRDSLVDCLEPLDVFALWAKLDTFLEDDLETLILSCYSDE